MESNQDQSSPLLSTGVDNAKSHFLDSMGLGENALRELATYQDSREKADDVALSSQPDDMELPGAQNAGVSIRVQASSGVQISASRSVSNLDQVPVPTPEEPESVARQEATPTEVPVEIVEESNETPVRNGEVSSEELAKSEELSESGNELLNLQCPKCEGELVLRPEHLGVDGACVWCQTPIVAAKSGVDDEVRIFPIFQPGAAAVADMAPEVAPAPLAPISEEVVVVVPEVEVEKEPEIQSAPVQEEPSSAPALLEDIPADADPFPQSAWPAPTESPASDNIMEAAAGSDQSAASAWSGDANERSTADPVATPQAAPEGFSTIVVSESVDAVEPAPQMATGFGEMPASSGFAAPSPDPQTEAIAEGFGAVAPSGFRDHTTQEIPPSMSEDVPPPMDAATGFSGFGDPAPVNDFAASQADAPAVDQSPEAVPQGFGAGASWSPPEPMKGATSEAPSFLEASGGFGEAATPHTDSVAEVAPASPQSESVADEAPAGFVDPNVLNAGFGVDQAPDKDPFASAQPVMGAEANTREVTPAPEFPDTGGFASAAGFGSSASAVEDEQPAAFNPISAATEVEQSEPSDSNSGFEIPTSESQASAFGALPPAEETVAIPSGFGVSSPVADPFGGSNTGEAIGMPAPEPVDEAPSEVESAEASDVGATRNDEIPESPFAASTENAASETASSIFEPPATPEEGVFGSLSEDSVVEVSADARYEAAEISQKTTEGALAPEVPNVTSQPLGKKSKKPIRKGFVVLMVVIVGFVCGAALASYVLPVDEYVAKARAMMDKKFNPAGLVEMPAPQPGDPVPGAIPANAPPESAPPMPLNSSSVPAAQAAAPSQP